MAAQRRRCPHLPPGMVALTDLHAVWPADQDFMSTRGLVARLKNHNPDYWGADSPYGKPLSDHRFARLVAQATKTTSCRPDPKGPRGYPRAAFEPAWRRLGITPTPSLRPALAAESAHPAMNAPIQPIPPLGPI